MASARDNCISCGNFVPRDQGVAFGDGGITDLACFVDGNRSTDAAHPVSVPATQKLLGVHLLIVDDAASTIDLLRTALEYCGAFVTTAENAIEGEAILREVRPHVLVSDIAMPNNGLEMVRHIMSFAAKTGFVIPAVAISADWDRRNHLREAGFSAFFPKPLDPFVLAEVVARLSRERRRS